METKQVISSDYNQLCEWWREWGWEHPIPADMLSDKGVMICEGGVNICAGFLYTMNNAPIAWFTFPVSNPHIRKDLRKDAIKLLIDTISKQAEEAGAKYIYSALRNENMIEAQIANGFVKAGKNYTELLKII